MLAGVCWIMAGCSEEKASSVKPMDEDEFAAYCEDSGGTMDGERCVCDGAKCGKYVVCDTSTGECANGTVIQGDSVNLEKCEEGTPDVCEINEAGDAILKKCFSGYLIEEKCVNGCNNRHDGCSASFGDLCEGTGGKLADDGVSCICGDKTCPRGDLCVSDPKHMICSSDLVLDGGCTDGDTRCIDGIDDIGETYTCVDGKWERDKDIDGDGKEVLKRCAGSCNRAQTACGESGCLNYTLECRDDLLLESTQGGAIGECQHGKWQVMRACSDGVSCNKETGNCGECKNDTYRCENLEVAGIMNRNCTHLNGVETCEQDANGNMKYYPATIGIQLLCYDGRWSDPYDLTRSSYCPPVSHTFQRYYNYNLNPINLDMTKLYRDNTKYDDYHYSSCHNTETKRECGECNNSFVICSDEQEDKLYGHMQRCTNGVLVYSNYCGNKTQLCKDFSACK